VLLYFVYLSIYSLQHYKTWQYVKLVVCGNTWPLAHFYLSKVICRLGFKTCLSKTKTKTLRFQDQDQDQDFDVQDQDRDSRLTNKILEVCDWYGQWQTKRLKQVMASRKSSIPVVTHTKQQNIIPCLTTVTVNHCSVSNFGVYTQHFESTTFDRQLKH